MQDKISRDRIISLINKEVVPAIGCTEPMAVALATARATEALGSRPAKITALLSANILKNAMGVGIPGTGMIGLPIAIALGALIGKSEYQLEVLRDLTPQTLEEGKQYIAEKRIDIKLKEDITEKLYVEIICNDEEGRESKAIISGGHTHFVFVSSPSATLLDLKSGTTSNTEEDDIQLCMRMVYDFATTAPLDEISFILKTKEYNMNAARKAILGNYGHNLGKTIDRPLAQGIFGKSIFSHIIARTASACDARMG